MLLEKDVITDISRIRDVSKQHEDDVGLALVSIENQMSVHYTMPVRTMLTDALRYTQQCKAMEQEHRTQKDLHGSAEFLSGITAHDRIAPMLTMVIYYGEDAWNGPECLTDMMSIPDGYGPYINNYALHVFQARDGHQYAFKNRDNQDFFMLLSELYQQKGRIDINEFEKRHPGMDVYWETLAAVGAATGTTSLIRLAFKHKGDDIRMCTALQGLIDEGRNEAITGTINILRNFQISDDLIMKNIQQEFGLPTDAVKKFMNYTVDNHKN